MSEDFELDPADVYALACFEVGRDGVLEHDEEMLLERIRAGMGLAEDQARAIRQKAFATPRALDTDPIPFDRLDLFAQVCRMAWIDQELSEDERALLLGLARLLGIPAGTAAARLEAARALMASAP